MRASRVVCRARQVAVEGSVGVVASCVSVAGQAGMTCTVRVASASEACAVGVSAQASAVSVASRQTGAVTSAVTPSSSRVASDPIGINPRINFVRHASGGPN